VPSDGPFGGNGCDAVAEPAIYAQLGHVHNPLRAYFVDCRIVDTSSYLCHRGKVAEEEGNQQYPSPTAALGSYNNYSMDKIASLNHVEVSSRIKP
jgi:hypothetical protein